MGDLTKPADYRRRFYLVEGSHLDKAKKIELLVRIDGETVVHLQAREPGMLVFVSKPKEQGFEVHVVEVAEQAYRDMAVPELAGNEDLLPWQADALELK